MANLDSDQCRAAEPPPKAKPRGLPGGGPERRRDGRRGAGRQSWGDAWLVVFLALAFACTARASRANCRAWRCERISPSALFHASLSRWPRADSACHERRRQRENVQRSRNKGAAREGAALLVLRKPVDPAHIPDVRLEGNLDDH